MMISLIKEELEEFESLLPMMRNSTNENELCSLFSDGKASEFEQLTNKEAKKILSFLREVEMERNLVWLILLYAFELKIIDGLAHSYHPTALVLITDYIKKAGLTNKMLNKLNVEEYERVLTHFRLLLKLDKQDTGERTQRAIVNDIKTKKAFMKPITPEQLRCLNTLISKQGIPKDEKEAMVFGFSGGRATSSKALFFSEAIEMIKHLKASDPNERMRKKVFALAREAGIIYGETSEDKKINIVVIDAFLLKNGTIKKKLNAMSKEELVKVVSQFQQIAKHTSESKASKATKGMLEELNIPTSTKRLKKTI